MKSCEMVGRVAAFFDLDGTLIAGPSLERRFLADLRARSATPMGNYFLWMARAVWLAPRGFRMMRYANKMILRGLRCGERETDTERGQPKMAVPRFLPEGVDQVAWHAQQGHAIVLVSGTLAPLAQEMALALVVRLAVRGIAASLAVCATRLDLRGGRWTGHIVGDAMVGEAKGRAVRKMAVEKGFDLAQSYAYGDSLSDRWMLDAVGRAVVVNPSWRMARLARRLGWVALTWSEKGNSTQSAQRSRDTVWRPEKMA